VFARARVAVPDQVSVVGSSSRQIARLPYLQLTTVSQDTGRLAALAVERAVARLDGQPVRERDVVLAPHLVVRGTTARHAS
jgi:DNA-binding LacI/PurR family transcriptional regulator